MVTNPFDTLNARTKRVENFSYKLDGSSSYALDTAFTQDADIDEKRMSVRFCFADGNRRDGVGDLLEVGGIRLERHRLNPIVCFDHSKSIALPIGLAEDPETRQYTVEIDPMERKAFLRCFFYQGKGLAAIDRSKEKDHALFCEQLFDLVSKRFIRGGSIGYLTVKALHLQPEYTDWQPAQSGLHLLVTLMLEGSIVVMPCNSDTVLKMLSLPNVCGKPMSPYLVKSLSAMAPERKAQLGYEKGFTNTESWKDKEKIEKKEIDKFPYGKIEDKKTLVPGLEAGRQRFNDRRGMGWKYKQETRKKYRKAKGLRSRHRNSRPGSSTIRVQKDMEDSFRQKATAMGIKVSKITDEGKGCVNARVAGDNEAIDQLAIEFGKRAGYGSKSMAKDQLRRNKKTLSGVVSQTYDKDPTKLRSEALRLLQLYCETAYEGYRQKAWDCLLASGFALGGVSRTKQGAEQLIAKLTKDGVKPGDNYNVTTSELEGGREPIGVKSVKNIKTKASPAAKPSYFGNCERDEEGHCVKQSELGDHQEEEKTPADMSTPDTNLEEEDTKEPYGGQVMRRIHEDHNILMEDYDEMLQVLENPSVHKHLTKILEGIEETLTTTEEIFQHEYAELDGLEYAGSEVSDKDGSPEEPADEESETSETEPAFDGSADSGEDEEEEPTEEEAVEGMQSKRLIANARRVLRQHYKALNTVHGQGVASTPGGTGEAVHGQGTPAKGSPPGASEAVHGQGKKNVKPTKKNFIGDVTTNVETTKPSGPSSYSAGKEPLQQHTESVVPGGAHGTKGVGNGVDDETGTNLGVEGSHEPGDEATSGSELKIHPYEQASSSNAVKFLKDLTEYDGSDGYGSGDYPTHLAYEKRLDAYLHHKLLDPIQSRFEEHFKNFISDVTTEVETTKPSGQLDYSPNKEPLQQHTESTVPGGVHGSKSYEAKHSSSHEFYKALCAANSLFKELSAGDLKGWTREHKQKAIDAYAAFKNFISEETGEVEVTKVSGPSDYSPGGEPMQQHEESIVPGGEQGSKALKEMIDSNKKGIDSLSKMLEKLVSVRL